MLDNIIFRNDPEYEFMKPFDNVMVNYGNIGIVNTYLLSIDVTIDYSISDLKIIRNLVHDKEFMKKVFFLTSLHFEFEKSEEEELISSFYRHFNIFIKYATVVDELLIWSGVKE